MIYDNVKRVCEKQGISISTLEKKLEFSNGSICKWNDNEPGIRKVQKVADYLGVPIEKLLEQEARKTNRTNGVKEQISNQKLIQISNKIGDLVISSGLSYNQAKKVFDITLEALNDVPYSLSPCIDEQCCTSKEKPVCG